MTTPARTSTLADELTPAQEGELLALLRDAIQAIGVERFLTRAIVTPGSLALPAPWTGTPLEVGRVAQRLLSLAGVSSEHAVRLIDAELAAVVRNDALGTSWHIEGPAVLFAGLTAGAHPVFTFHIDTRACVDPQLVFGALARAVASAVRCLEGMVPSSNGLEEGRRADVTCVALGLGVFAANDARCTVRIDDWPLRASESLATFAGAPGSFANNTNRLAMTYAQAAGGVLPPRAMTFLLAAVHVARGIDPAPACEALASNQAEWMKQSVRALASRDVLTELSLSPSAHAPAVRARVDASLVEEKIIVEMSASDGGGAVAGPVFRVKRSAIGRGALLGGMASGAVVYFSAIIPGFGPLGALASALAIPVFAAAGALVRADHCASCDAVLAQGVMTCPGCRGQIVGRVARASDRLRAEEDYVTMNKL